MGVATTTYVLGYLGALLLIGGLAVAITGVVADPNSDVRTCSVTAAYLQRSLGTSLSTTSARHFKALRAKLSLDSGL